MQLKKKNSLLIILYLLFSVIDVNCQSVKFIGVNEGLSGRQVFSMIQDNKGFMWFSTRFGIDRYNGSSIKNYPLEILSSNRIPIIESHLIYSENNNSIICYTSNGSFYCHDNKSDTFIPYIDTQKYIKAAIFDNNERLWIGGNQYLGYIKDRKEYKYNHSFSKKEIIKDIQFDKKNGIVLITNSNLYYIDKNSDKTSKIISEKVIKTFNFNIESACIDNTRGVIWIGTSNKGLFRYHIGSNILKEISCPQLINTPILTIKTNMNKVLIGTDGAGLLVFDITSNVITEHYAQNEKKSHKISSNSVYDIMTSKDVNGNEKIWLSTFSNGVNIISSEDDMFKKIAIYRSNNEILPSQRVCSMVENNDDNIWIATDLGIYSYNQDKQIWKQILEDINVITLFKDSNGLIWAGTFSAGVIVFDKNGNIVKRLSNQNNSSFGTDYIYTISEDSKGRIWTGGKKGKVSIIDTKTNNIKSINIEQVNYITPMNDSIMVIASEGGVHYYNINTESYSKYQFSDKLKSLYVCDLYQESDSILWLATYGNGINKCNIRTNEVSSYTIKNGLQSDIIYSLLPNGNELWYSSEKGLGRFNLKTHNVNNFTLKDGLSENRFRQLSRTIDNKGNFYFGSYEGIVKFRPSNIVYNQAKGKIFLESLSIFNKVINSKSKKSPLTEHIDDISKISLKYWQHSFSIDFSAIDFSDHKSNHFEWNLEGLNDIWESRTGEQVVNFTNLLPGKYKLHIKYVNEDGSLIDQRTLPIEIQPPFWKEPWARVIEFIVLALIIGLIINYLRNRLNKQQAEAKVKFFISMAHDIRTPLTLINNPIIQLKQEIPETQSTKYLFELISTNLDKLNKMLSLLLDFQKVYEKKEKLNIKRHNLNIYLKRKAVYWQSYTKEKKLNIELDIPENEVIEWFDEDKMDNIIDNLIMNSIKYTPKEGTVRICLSEDTENWYLSVNDTGIGISDSEQKKLFNRFFRATNAINSNELGTGLGLYIVKEYVTLHHGKINFVSKKDEGTTFTVSMKKGNTHYLPEELCIDTSKTENNEENNIKKENNKTISAYKKENKLHKILIVDDNIEFRDYLKNTLSHNYEITTASNGVEAIEIITHSLPEIVITDLQMPIMNGLELCCNIKNNKETSHIIVIIVTAQDEDEMQKQVYTVGADDFIKKPFDIVLLKNKINNIIKSRIAIQQKYIGLSSDKENDNKTSSDELFIKQTNDIIEKHLSDTTFGVNELSEELHLSRSVLYTKFSNISEYTPNDYIKMVRINKSILYMKEKRYSIKEIALMVGFEEASYFSTCFKKIHGKSPKQYMEEIIIEDRNQ